MNDILPLAKERLWLNHSQDKSFRQKNEIFFSLVVATVDRTEELIQFLNSLLRIVEKNFEVILVDQNNDNRLKKIVEEYSYSLSVKWLKLSERNVSKARNVGVQHALGKWIGFPDDDCLYSGTTLSSLKTIINESDAQIISGCLLDLHANPLSKYTRKQSKLTFLNFIGKVPEPTLFMRKSTFYKIGGFNEDFGLGGKYFSSEAYDLIIKAIKRKEKIIFNSSIKIYHPRKTPPYNKEASVKGYKYAYGFGCFLAKHFGVMSFPYIAAYTLKFLYKIIVFNLEGKKYALQCYKGFMKGFIRVINE